MSSVAAVHYGVPGIATAIAEAGHDLRSVGYGGNSNKAGGAVRQYR